MSNQICVPVSVMRRFSMEALAAVGAGDEEQSIVADSLLFADMRGITSHGVSKLPVYIKRVLAGSINPKAKPECVVSRGYVACIDGHNAFGQVAASVAMRHAIMLALSGGVGVVVVRNSNHFGAAGYFALMAASRNLIGVALSNANPTMAPWGGSRLLLGTNPIAIAVPTGDECPFVLDLACSTVSRGRIIEAARLGRPIPPGWALDKNGNPTTDPQEALRGQMAPLGGVKGSGLAEAVDILSGVLSGARFLSSVGPLYQDLDKPQGVGHFFAAVNVADI
ncbi:MAG TPA: Ldh family oxidoreductase, partial [Firmicutes bacterium]|nr:Ldh family oxidoreductase [Bacillota bacterium]